MGAALGMGLGLLLKVGSEYERNKFQQEAQQKAEAHQFYLEGMKSNPDAFKNNPMLMQGAKKAGISDELAMAAMAMGQASQQATNYAMSVGTGAPQPAAAAGAPNPMMSAPTIPTPAGPSGTSIVGGGERPPTGLPGGMTPEKFQTLSPEQQVAYVRQASMAGRTGGVPMEAPPPDLHPAMAGIWHERDKLEAELKAFDAYMSGQDHPGQYAHLPEGVRRTIEHRRTQVENRIAKLQEEADKPGMAAVTERAKTPALLERERAGIPIKAAGKTAEEQAAEAVRTSPGVVAGEARRSATVKAAETATEQNIKNAPTNVGTPLERENAARAARTAADEAKTRATARLNTLRKAYEADHKPPFFQRGSLLGGGTSPAMQKYIQERDAYIRELGIDPTSGELLGAGASAAAETKPDKDVNGKPIYWWKDGTPHYSPEK